MFNLAQSETFPQQWDVDYETAEQEFASLLADVDLDDLNLRRHRRAIRGFERALNVAIAAAYGAKAAAYGLQDTDPARVNHRAHRFLQRVLYRINRLTLFWYDELRHYRNERSPYLHALRGRIEDAWQAYELVPHSIAGDPHSIAALRASDVAAGLRARTAEDLDPRPSEAGVFFRDHASLDAYRRLLAIASLDGLVEASQLSRTLGGVSNPIHATLTKLLVEEYGGGRLAKKHSSYFRAMLEALGMNTTPEAYFDIVPWEVLSGINASFLLSDRKRHFLRYVGGLLYTEISVPAAFRCYQHAAVRLGLPDAARIYWDLHIKEDARHGPWMLNDVALPLIEQYPDDAWELLLGYDQQRRMSSRASAAIASRSGSRSATC